LIVVAGTPTIRTPEGKAALEAGDVVCFPVRPAGAHRADNAGDETVPATKDPQVKGGRRGNVTRLNRA
jgi:uncharacterized cupin superfamily protein